MEALGGKEVERSASAERSDEEVRERTSVQESSSESVLSLGDGLVVIWEGMEVIVSGMK